MHLKSNVLFLLLFHFFYVAKAENMDSLMNYTQVSLITCDPGSDLYSLFGHSAVRVKNQSQNYDAVYNYGTFDFNTPGFMVKFMRGKLPYKLVANSYDSFLMEYNYSKRGVREQVLEVSNEEKVKIIGFLENNALPENALYKYDFFYDNCSTRIRDVFEKNLKYKTDYKSKEEVTFRDLLHQYLTGSTWTRLGIDMVIGSLADKQADPSHQMFLPDKLHNVLGSHLFNGKTFLSKSYTVLQFDAEREARKVGAFFNPTFFNSLLCIIIIVLFFTNKEKGLKWLTNVWNILAFLSSVIILLLWFATDHIPTTLNWNILWLNPFYLLLFFKKFKYRKELLYLLLGLFVLCLLNNFVPFMPQVMPIWQLSFAFLLLTYQVSKTKAIVSKKAIV
jgi:hypothetical protein